MMSKEVKSQSKKRKLDDEGIELIGEEMDAEVGVEEGVEVEDKSEVNGVNGVLSGQNSNRSSQSTSNSSGVEKDGVDDKSQDALQLAQSKIQELEIEKMELMKTHKTEKEVLQVQLDVISEHLRTSTDANSNSFSLSQCDNNKEVTISPAELLKIAKQEALTFNDLILELSSMNHVLVDYLSKLKKRP
eukprot:TRINITY_DN7324_c0_g1_i1.p1 TRINITY_DN7324_c0_g1~~TRINITY_DN7324_c0_g1_i1.p1  ORF type:complete len:188 (-),score=41.85 TRINITY_DN7324_c0_g1_i1:17-580(-)